ncbi:MAG: HD domain-containing protein [Defluviitaleaceae bacterium]|nr:HD domain-containing protein [Defluviitaleaceae bacterium]
MEAYNKYFNDSEINKILDNNNKLQNEVFTACHGRYHAMFTVGMVEHILGSLSYDTRTIELGKIAALMHDIGNIAGRQEHPRKGAALAAIFLDDPALILPAEKDIIVQAIQDHSKGKNIASPVGAALLIADKVDISYKRILPKANIDHWHKNLLEIRDVEVHVSDKVITINYITTDKFSKDLLISDYEKGFKLPVMAVEYLGCDCVFRFNGVGEV